MAPLPKKILVFGATGVIGKYIISGLVDAKASVEKIGIFTLPTTVENQDVEVLVGNVESEADVTRAYDGCDTVISALGRSTILVQTPLHRLAEASPTIHTFFPSEFGTDNEYSTSTSTHEKLHQLKLQVRKYVREYIRKVAVTYLVTGPYSDLYLSAQAGDFERAGSFDVKGGKAVLLGDGDSRVAFTSMRDVGVLLVAALKTSGEGSPRTLKVNSFTATPWQILVEFERQTGKVWCVEYTGDGTRYTLRRIWTERGTLHAERVNGIIGEPNLETLERQVRLSIERQLGKGQA
ncbi:NAD(P)-binding protein [Paraphaeosphaeria sporulosa]|uniref:NAD(P)-binding protein n=1 Tax=Paraphaeosphaeria sporulosa TaxID=1460663 RepID=A0A177BXF3_9PLEO|nr:NAD(P)-binding protein [Paraphaeosphaeria sporulosa]OAF99640.1 NAD(P)-binding protein [Paraphaeosphaeria sporulosa]